MCLPTLLKLLRSECKALLRAASGVLDAEERRGGAAFPSLPLTTETILFVGVLTIRALPLTAKHHVFIGLSGLRGAFQRRDAELDICLFKPPGPSPSEMTLKCYVGSIPPRP